MPSDPDNAILHSNPSPAPPPRAARTRFLPTVASHTASSVRRLPYPREVDTTTTSSSSWVAVNTGQSPSGQWSLGGPPAGKICATVAILDEPSAQHPLAAACAPLRWVHRSTRGVNTGDVHGSDPDLGRAWCRQPPARSGSRGHRGADCGLGPVTRRSALEQDPLPIGILKSATAGDLLQVAAPEPCPDSEPFASQIKRCRVRAGTSSRRASGAPGPARRPGRLPSRSSAAQARPLLRA